MTGGPALPPSGEPLTDAATWTSAEKPGAAGQGRQLAGTGRPRLTTERQIAYWRRSGLLRPGTTEMAQARTIAALRRAGVSIARIRAASDRLQASWAAFHDHDPPFEPFASGSPLPGPPESAAAGLPRFAVLAGELFIRHPDGTWEGDSQPGQLIIDGVLPLPGSAPAAATPAEPRSSEAAHGRHAPGPDREAILRFVARENAHATPRRETPSS
ncbi:MULTISPECIES: helix-turn-helix domain-containing protein [unclassified Pseudofrankia]|uniref:helix-turn-helix domain-containing protein n=1 Tax=unclassified Pseudofrankia TaxID=2994372 RepID=UPI0008DA093E|nr:MULTISPECIES: helix-turn-helix domain-containing protein [unclassified Pseudofrankia]MDT3440119.1 helix-turn-helix domain-containing protein [Pseudofrankia sp. BMG5.37]OHV44727.1 hypothetical protein BCD48_24940 [Pseudofrankia sp. BMG5.36]